MKGLKFSIYFLSVLAISCLFLPALHVYSSVLPSPDIRLSLISLFRPHSSTIIILFSCILFLLIRFNQFGYALFCSVISLVCAFSSLSQLDDQLRQLHFLSKSFPLSVPIIVSDYGTSFVLIGALVLSFILISVCVFKHFSNQKMKQIEQLG